MVVWSFLSCGFSIKYIHSFIQHLILPGTGLYGETLFTTLAAGARVNVIVARAAISQVSQVCNCVDQFSSINQSVTCKVVQMARTISSVRAI